MFRPVAEHFRIAGRALIAGALLASSVLANEATTPEPEGYWTGDIHAPTPASLRGGHVIHAAALPALIKQGAVLVDASDTPHRPDNLPADSVWLPVPHKIIPNAVWIPGVGAGEIHPDVDELYRKQLEILTAGKRGTPIVVYCHEKCWLSWNAAKRALDYGYRNVSWFPEGIEGWTATKRPTAVADPLTPAH